MYSVRNFERILGGFLALALTAGSLAYAADKEKKDEIVYPEMKTSSGISRAFQAVTGFTAVSGFVANRVLRKELARHVEGDLRSKLEIYSGADLLGRKVKRFSVSGRDVLLENFVPLSEFRLESAGDMPIYVSKDRKPFLLRPVKLNVTAVMTEEDINRMLQSEKGQKLLTDIRFTLPPFKKKQSLDALEPRVEIQGDRLNIKSKINTHDAPPENALPIEIIGKVEAEKSQLKLSDLDIYAEGIDAEKTELVAGLVEDYFGELVNLSKVKVDRHKLDIAIRRSELREGKLFLETDITVKPEDRLIRKYLEAAKK